MLNVVMLRVVVPTKKCTLNHHLYFFYDCLEMGVSSHIILQKGLKNNIFMVHVKRLDNQGVYSIG